MTRRRALKCAKCGRAFRKGQGVQVLNFGTYEGITEEGQSKVSSWLAVATCTSHEPNDVRQAVLASKRKVNTLVASSEPAE